MWDSSPWISLRPGSTAHAWFAQLRCCHICLAGVFLSSRECVGNAWVHMEHSCWKLGMFEAPVQKWWPADLASTYIISVKFIVSCTTALPWSPLRRCLKQSALFRLHDSSRQSGSNGNRERRFWVLTVINLSLYYTYIGNSNPTTLYR